MFYLVCHGAEKVHFVSKDKNKTTKQRFEELFSAVAKICGVLTKFARSLPLCLHGSADQSQNLRKSTFFSETFVRVDVKATH